MYYEIPENQYMELLRDRVLIQLVRKIVEKVPEYDLGRHLRPILDCSLSVEIEDDPDEPFPPDQPGSYRFRYQVTDDAGDDLPRKPKE